jgi:hypothetical protein
MRTRTIVETRRIPHTVDGETLLIDEEYTRQVPLPPRDWDHIVLTSALGVIVLGLGVVIVWSTASIGALLTRAIAEPLIAYAAATGFCSGWIVCMAFEWLARYDSERVRRPRRAGHVFLVADMFAVCVHGYVADSLKVGVIGAVLSGGAKWLWTLALDHQAAPLDARTQQWVTIKRNEVGGRLALAAVRRQLTRANSRAAAEEAALRTTVSADADELVDETGTTDADILPLNPSGLTVKDAVKTAWDSGIREKAAATRYVSRAMGRAASPETVDRYLRALKVGA